MGDASIREEPRQPLPELVASSLELVELLVELVVWSSPELLEPVAVAELTIPLPVELLELLDADALVDPVAAGAPPLPSAPPAPVEELLPRSAYCIAHPATASATEAKKSFVPSVMPQPPFLAVWLVRRSHRKSSKEKRR